MRFFDKVVEKYEVEAARKSDSSEKELLKAIAKSVEQLQKKIKKQAAMNLEFEVEGLVNQLPGGLKKAMSKELKPIKSALSELESALEDLVGDENHGEGGLAGLLQYIENTMK